MLPLISLLLVIVLSLIVVRIATVALTHTGLSKESARFQARSAYTGTGFTTDESESVVNHPVRRRIIMMLMILRSGGFVTAIATLLLSFVDTQTYEQALLRFGILVGSIIALWFIASSRWIDEKLSNLIEWTLNNWTRLQVRDYAKLLHLSGQYSIIELLVCEGDWMANKKLGQLLLAKEGILVLGIQKQDGSYIGTPRGDSLVKIGDTLIVYGRAKTLERLDKRSADLQGFLDHQDAIHEQKQELQEQETIEKTHESESQKATPSNPAPPES
jgi:hypothetical protein